MKHALFLLIALLNLLSGTTMKLQLVNNSPTQTFDLYIHNPEELRSFDYRSSSIPLEIASSSVIGIAPVEGDVESDFLIESVPGSFSVGIISGLIGNTDSQLKIFTSNVNTSSVGTEYFAAKFFNGASDISSIDILINDDLLISGLEFGRFSGYEQLSVDVHNIQINDNQTGEKIEEDRLDLSRGNGGSGII